VLQQSEGHITTPAAAPAVADVPAPARTSNFVPAPKPEVKAPTYTVVVTEVPVKELLFALARDTKQNIDIHPGLDGRVSLNAIEETLPAILERISKQVGIRYRKIGNTLTVTPDEPYSKTYQINYVNMIRNSSSVTSVSGRIGGAGGQAAGGAGGGGGGGASGAGGTAQQSSTSSVTTSTVNDFWKVLETDLRGILTSVQNQSAQAKADRQALARTELQIRLQETRAAPAAALGAATPLGGGPEAAAVGGAAAAAANRNRPEDVLVNPISGTVTVSATEAQHELVQAYINRVQNQAQRQVLIEATIVEVKLSDQYQAGVDWSRVAITGGVTFQQSLLAGNIGTAPNFAIGYTNPNSQIGNVAAAIKLLNQFGNTRVLSSPKLMAMNNQTALLKVTDDIVFFTVSVTPGQQNSTTTTLPTISTTPTTLEVGVVMSLTPQINENGQVMLSVRPSITRLLDFVNDPNPELAKQGVVSKVPQLQKREMESVLQLTSGQTAILGGLMQDNAQYNRNAVPGIGNPANTGVISEIFGYRNDQQTKSELIIFLRPTIITKPSLESEELKFFERMLPKQTDSPNDQQNQKTGAAK
jgi:general secretion pathway protein D